MIPSIWAYRSLSLIGDYDNLPTPFGEEPINDFDGLVVASTHGSPWRYDTFVPVMFAGNGLSAKQISRAVTPYDIAVTLAAYLGVKAPSGSIGNQLPEVMLNSR